MPPHHFHDVKQAQHWDANNLLTNPIRAEQLDIVLTILADSYKAGHWILDLGFGSGIVEEMIFQRIPQAQVVGVDHSIEMMRLAEERLRLYQDHYQAVEHNLADLDSLTLPPYDYQFAIASQSLHHLRADEMRAAYEFIYNTLLPEGLFLLVDRVQINTPNLWPVWQSLWRRLDKLHDSIMTDAEGAALPEHERILRERGDMPLPLETHLRWLREIGFECAILHLHANRALIAAKKLAPK